MLTVDAFDTLSEAVATMTSDSLFLGGGTRGVRVSMSDAIVTYALSIVLRDTLTIGKTSGRLYLRLSILEPCRDRGTTARGMPFLLEQNDFSKILAGIV